MGAFIVFSPLIPGIFICHCFPVDMEKWKLQGKSNPVKTFSQGEGENSTEGVPTGRFYGVVTAKPPPLPLNVPRSDSRPESGRRDREIREIDAEFSTLLRFLREWSCMPYVSPWPVISLNNSLREIRIGPFKVSFSIMNVHLSRGPRNLWIAPRKPKPSLGRGGGPAILSRFLLLFRCIRDCRKAVKYAVLPPPSASNPERKY